jgi:hypothetical protein
MVNRIPPVPRRIEAAVLEEDRDLPQQEKDPLDESTLTQVPLRSSGSVVTFQTAGAAFSLFLAEFIVPNSCV